jgi:hypothetical protein
VTDEQKLMALQERALELTVEYAPKHEYRDPDSGNACFSALGFARDLVKALEDETVEVWHRDRKVVIYADSVLRVWGPNIETEMSNAPRSLQSVQDAMDWLYAEPPEGKCRECSNTGYVADGNHCMACSVPADLGIDHYWKVYQAGRGSADHTDKEAFAQTLQLFAECTKG